MTDLPTHMQAVVLTAHGGPDKLEVHADWPVPRPSSDEVLIRVGGCAVNNTDINTRIGWYSKTVTGSTDDAMTTAVPASAAAESSWSGAAIRFPRIQGADLCGVIVATGANVPERRLGERVLVAAMQPRPASAEGLDYVTFGADMDGGFADYAVAASDMAYKVTSNLNDLELASFPCAASTAENMLDRISLTAGERVLVTGASGGVGSAAVQLAKMRGAQVVAVASADKHDFVRRLGADEVWLRDAALPVQHFDVVVDLVAGNRWPDLIEALKRGGRYIAAGAIAGPIAEIDLRTVYLRDLIIAGSTYQPPHVFANLVRSIEAGAIRPVVSKVYPLSQIRQAQADFVGKTYPGKLVLVPDSLYRESAGVTL